MDSVPKRKLKERKPTMTKPPRSIVIRHRKGMFKTRQGRGFSKAELREAGISSAEATRLKLNTDQKRHTKLDENLRALKTWLGDRKDQNAAKA